MFLPALATAVAIVQLPAEVPDRSPTLLTIQVYTRSPETREYRIEITQAVAGLARTAEEASSRVWVATRTLDGRSESVASTECSAISSVARSFAELPAIPIYPVGLQHGESTPIGPYMLDGLGITLRFSTRMPDNTFAQVEVSGGVFQQWGQMAVSDLHTCWEMAHSLAIE